MSEAIQPFRISVPDTDLADLRERLARTRWPDQIEGTGWELGSELSYVKELAGYWQEKFDWRAQEAALNRWEHGTSQIDGQRIHFLHARSRHADAFPLVLTHGWPGSIVEFQKILPLLTDPEAHGGSAADAFHVVCPSLPGYGFSGPTRERGWDPQRIAEAEVELMRRLGYTRYGAQGGDWGAIITSSIGQIDPDHCAGIHLNMVMSPPHEGAELSAQEQAWVAETAAFGAHEAGYQKIQGTKPQTLGYALSDSPAGLLGWIVEKFRTWSDCGGDLESVFHRDEILTNVSVYWFTRTINSSIRLYYEAMNGGRIFLANGRVEVPTGCAVFPKEVYKVPRAWAEKHYNVTHWTVMPEGGHFAAMEKPALLAADVRSFFGPLR